jgi:cytochrome c5
LKRDQKFFDMYSLVIGVLAIFAVAILVLAMKMTSRTQDVFTSGTDEYKAAVDARLKPFGQVYLPGEEAKAGEPVVVAAAATQPVATQLTGPQVYNEACIACHGSGIGGAPKFGDAAAWAPRIAQGSDTLHSHAINGYAGSAGYMPPKGARVDLSDQEIRDAVDYMVSQSK